MNMIKVSCAVSLLCIASTCFGQMYTVNELIPAGNFASVWGHANDINASGQVVGNWSAVDNLGNVYGFPFRTAPNSPINPTTDDLITDAPCTVESHLAQATPNLSGPKRTHRLSPLMMPLLIGAADGGAMIC